MDFLKLAVASAISKDPPFPYKFGDRLTVDQSIWTLHNGTKRVCVFQKLQIENFLTRLRISRKMGLIAAYSHSMLPQTNPVYRSLGTQYERCEH